VAIGAAAALAGILTAGLVTAGASASPAEEEYTLDLPSASNAGAGDGGGVDGDAGGSDAPPEDSGGTETAPPPSTDTETDIETDTSTGSGGSGGGDDDDGRTGQRAGDGKGGTLEMDGGEATPAQPHTVPAIATDVAGEGGIPLLLAGLIAVAALAVLWAIWKRRRPSPEG
jgi:hypothetical protein